MRIAQRNIRQRTAAHLDASAPMLRRGAVRSTRLVFCGQVSPSGTLTDAVIERPRSPPATTMSWLCCAVLWQTATSSRNRHRARDGGVTGGVESAIELHLANRRQVWYRWRGATPFALANAALDAGVVTLSDLRTRHG